MFQKGVLLKDPNHILIQQTKNSQSARQIRFTNVQEIIDMEDILKAYIHNAMEVEKAGLEVELKKTSEYTIPDELQTKFDEMPDLKPAFKSLTRGGAKELIFFIFLMRNNLKLDSQEWKNIRKKF